MEHRSLKLNYDDDRLSTRKWGDIGVFLWDRDRETSGIGKDCMRGERNPSCFTLEAAAEDMARWGGGTARRGAIARPNRTPAAIILETPGTWRGKQRMDKQVGGGGGGGGARERERGGGVSSPPPRGKIEMFCFIIIIDRPSERFDPDASIRRPCSQSVQHKTSTRRDV